MKKCKELTHSLDRHHIKSKAYGGTNHKSNLAYLCQNCHKSVHLNLNIIEGRFFTSHGDLLIWRVSGEPSVTGKEDPKLLHHIKQKRP